MNRSKITINAKSPPFCGFIANILNIIEAKQ